MSPSDSAPRGVPAAELDDLSRDRQQRTGSGTGRERQQEATDPAHIAHIDISPRVTHPTHLERVMAAWNGSSQSMQTGSQPSWRRQTREAFLRQNGPWYIRECLAVIYIIIIISGLRA